MKQAIPIADRGMDQPHLMGYQFPSILYADLSSTKKVRRGSRSSPPDQKEGGLRGTIKTPIQKTRSEKNTMAVEEVRLESLHATNGLATAPELSNGSDLFRVDDCACRAGNALFGVVKQEQIRKWFS
ncbi:hypothetical protein ASD00_34570 [Ensifer sp. Root31]|jgi:hypothetical protein|uniref:hypothetical protein n=1 Tax=Ensifer sp. Root31 TaxID=1736512 RepID=UPI00070C3EE9|nr:hypothetical protein [Ensifer sp. Root31]KQU81817.1 hypothetical protein ASD00_34570 [Ensifer sp. Root31]